MILSGTPKIKTIVRTTEYISGDVEVEGESMAYGKTYKYYFGDGYVQFYPGSSRSPQYYFYSKDHLGNVRSVVTKNPSTNEIAEVQQTHYYPFGGIIADLSFGTSKQNKLYNGKELDASNNLWWYDYGARQYDPTAPRFTTPDPLAEKYFSVNPYVYCLNNPVMLVDPNGMDVYELDENGRITNTIEDKTQDAFSMVDANHQSIDGKFISFAYGTIKGYEHIVDGDKNYDIFNISGDDNSAAAFEFLANNTGVEWSHLLTGNSAVGNNFLSTEHSIGFDGSVNYVTDNLIASEEIIRGHNHNHPSGNDIPSGMYPSNTNGDVFYAKKLESRANKLGQTKPIFKIYANKRYIQYSSISKFEDFGRNPDGSINISLPDIEICVNK